MRRQPTAVHETLWDFRLAAWQLAEATGQDPKDRDRLIKFPDDCPQPENIYGYQALRQDIRHRAGGPDSRLGRRPIPPEAGRPGRPRLSRAPAPAQRRPRATHFIPKPVHLIGPVRGRKSTRRTGRRRSWGADRRIQRRNPGGSNSSRKDAGPGPMATRPRAIAGVSSPYDRI